MTRSVMRGLTQCGQSLTQSVNLAVSNRHQAWPRALHAYAHVITDKLPKSTSKPEDANTVLQLFAKANEQPAAVEIVVPRLPRG
jgi:hypothetical protein